MHDHNLDDLIIDNISPKNSKTKNFLTFIALAIVMLIIAIILTKIILKDPENTNSGIDDNTVYVSPDLTLDSIDDKDEIVKAPQIPTTEEIKPDIQTENISSDKQAESEKRKALEEQAREAQKQIERNIQKEAEAKAQALSIAKAREKKQATEAKLAQENTNKKIEEAAKNIEQKKDSNHPFFIQVGSFAKTPSERFLSVIKNSGFNYQITIPSANGSKKLLIGPYHTKTAADQALVRVKDRINKSAYIIRK